MQNLFLEKPVILSFCLVVPHLCGNTEMEFLSLEYPAQKPTPLKPSLTEKHGFANRWGRWPRDANEGKADVLKLFLALICTGTTCSQTMCVPAQFGTAKGGQWWSDPGNSIVTAGIFKWRGLVILCPVLTHLIQERRGEPEGGSAEGRWDVWGQEHVA